MKHYIFLMLAIAIILCVGCESINSIISPEKQCALLKTGAKVGAGYLYDDVLSNNAKTHIERISSILERQIMPKLKGTGENVKSITREDLDWILDLLNKELTDREKEILQNGIDLVLAWAPDMPEAKDETIGKQLLDNIICLFEGLLEGITSKIAVKTASIQPQQKITLQWKCSICGEGK